MAAALWLLCVTFANASKFSWKWSPACSTVKLPNKNCFLSKAFHVVHCSQWKSTNNPGGLYCVLSAVVNGVAGRLLLTTFVVGLFLVCLLFWFVLCSGKPQEDWVRVDSVRSEWTTYLQILETRREEMLQRAEVIKVCASLAAACYALPHYFLFLLVLLVGTNVPVPAATTRRAFAQCVE